MLYERDYLLGLTEAEKQEYEEATGRKFGEKRVSGFGRVNNFWHILKLQECVNHFFLIIIWMLRNCEMWNVWLLQMKNFFLY